MRLFQLGMQIDRRRQMLVQQFDGLGPDILGQRIVCRLHVLISNSGKRREQPLNGRCAGIGIRRARGISGAIENSLRAIIKTGDR
jgi:hypothetical protein